MRIPSQRANDRTTERPHTGSEQDITNDTAGAGAEEAVSGFVRLFLLVFLMVVVVLVGAVVVGWLLLLRRSKRRRVGVLLLWRVAVGAVGRWLRVR